MLPALRRLVEGRVTPFRVLLPEGVKRDQTGLLDVSTGARSPANLAAQQALDHLLVEQLTVGEACTRMAERYPGTSASADSLRLVVQLNDAGMLNIAPGDPGYQARFGRVADDVLHGLRRLGYAGLSSTLTQRAEFQVPQQLRALAAFVAGSLRFLVISMLAVVAVIGMIAGPALALEMTAAVFVLALSAVAHELAHAAALGAGRVTAVASLAGPRVVVPDESSPTLARAAVAGPAAGLAVSLVALVLASVLQHPVLILVSLVVAAGHAWSVSPWSADGRVLNHALRLGASEPASSAHSEKG